MRAYRYIRSATGDKETMESQQIRLRIYAKEQGYPVVGQYEDIGSGTNFERAGLIIVKSLTRNDVDAVLVTNLSRIGRDIFKTNDFIRCMNEKGVRIISLEEHLLPEPEFLPIIQAYMRKEIVAKSKARKKVSKRKGDDIVCE